MTGIPRTIALVAALSLLASACTHSPRTTLHIQSAGDCTPVDVSAAPETAWLLAQAAEEFNASPAARTPSGCTFVRVQSLDAPAALHELLEGWPDTNTLGPAPSAWAPPSSAWSALLNARLIAQREAPFATAGTPVARTPVVVAMPVVMAEALGYPARPIGWADLGRLAANPAGWAAYGHPEWGAFHLGFPNPNWATPGLDASVALYSTPALATSARALQQSVVYYTDTAQRYLDTWVRLSATRNLDAMRFMSAVVTDERTVASFNEGRTDSGIPAAKDVRQPTLPLVAISPRDGAIAADNPITVLNAPWAAPSARVGARAFAKFVLGASTQANIAAAGYRPVRGPVDAMVLNARNGVRVGRGAAMSQLTVSPVDAQRAINGWQTDRRKARVLVLFDESDSMGDHATTHLPAPPTKIALARPALITALAELAPTDDVGVRVFGTALPRHSGASWVDVAPVTAFGPARGRLLRVVNSLAPHGGSPLYAAVHDAYDAMARHLDRTRIDAVVVVTDGYNEDEHNTNLGALLAHLNPRVHVFTVAFSNDADLATLRKIAEATNAQSFDARNPTTIGDALARAFASF